MGLSRNEEICLKELDHLQAIVGRYDIFFFWSKNVCLVAIGAAVALRATSNLNLAILVPVPILFGIADVLFRANYWVEKIGRIKEISAFLNSPEVKSSFKLYTLGARACGVGEYIKQYDLIFYAVAEIVVLLLIVADCRGWLLT